MHIYALFGLKGLNKIPPSRVKQKLKVEYHSLADRDSCPTPAKSEGIEYLQSWTHRN